MILNVTLDKIERMWRDQKEGLSYSEIEIKHGLLPRRGIQAYDCITLYLATYKKLGKSAFARMKMIRPSTSRIRSEKRHLRAYFQSELDVVKERLKRYKSRSKRTWMLSEIAQIEKRLKVLG